MDINTFDSVKLSRCNNNLPKRSTPKTELHALSILYQ